MNEQLKSSQIREFVTKWLKNSKSGAIEKGEAADLPADALLGDAAEVPGRLHLVHAGVARLPVPAAGGRRLLSTGKLWTARSRLYRSEAKFCN